jgi:cell division protease FtsH
LVSGSYKAQIKLVGDENYKYYVLLPTRIAFTGEGSALEAWFGEMKEGNPEAARPSVRLIFNDPSQSSMLTSILFPLLMLLALIVLFVVMVKKSNGVNNKAMSFGKTKATQVQGSKTRFSDVAGAEEEKQELQEIVEFLKNPKKFEDIGARIPKGVLLVGPPGTGKTLFAKAVAGEANVPFFSLSGSDFVEMFVGVGASRVRDLFEQAKRNMPCIVFIDEIDAVGRQRGAGLGGGNDEREQTLNQLLVQMDGFETNESIIVMAATNRADILDPALMRPGRFDRQIYVHVPDVKGREEIFKVHSRKKPLGPDVQFKNIARLTSGFTGADIENLLNEAAILAARANRTIINMQDLSEALTKVAMGPAKKSRLVTAADKRITAYHEAGHAILAKTLRYSGQTVHEVSIIPRGSAGGYTLPVSENDNMYSSKNYLLAEIAMLLGGRAAEEIVIKDITTGASSDIKRASGIARKMVAEWGMSDRLKNMYLGSSEEIFVGRDYQTQLNFSDKIAAVIDEEVQKILDEQYQVALDLLKENRHIMDKMVKLLFEKETIYEEEIDKLFAPEAEVETAPETPATEIETKEEQKVQEEEVKADENSDENNA